MKVLGLMIKLMDLVSTFMLTALAMKESEKTTCSMAKARKLGLMALFTKGNTFKARSMATESTVGTMDRAMKGLGSRTKSEAWEPILG